MIRLLEIFRDGKVQKLFYVLFFFFSNKKISEITYTNNEATDK